MDLESKKFSVFSYVFYLSLSGSIAYWGWVSPGKPAMFLSGLASAYFSIAFLGFLFMLVDNLFNNNGSRNNGF